MAGFLVREMALRLLLQICQEQYSYQIQSIFSFLEIMILSWTTSIFSGESGMGAMFIMLASIGTLIANAITNLIIFLIKKS